MVVYRLLCNIAFGTESSCMANLHKSDRRGLCIFADIDGIGLTRSDLYLIVVVHMRTRYCVLVEEDWMQAQAGIGRFD